MENIYAARIETIRQLMDANGWDAVVLRGCDPHASEYLSARFQTVTWVSGFTGEAGDMVITMDHAGLWTDSRYFIQAGVQLCGTGVSLHKTRLPESVDIPSWLAAQGLRSVACDSLCESAGEMQRIRQACSQIEGFRLIGVPDLPDLFRSDRPALPSTPVITLDESTVGKTRMEKLQWLRESLMSDSEYMLVSALDEIAWLLNVRGSDIDYNPVVFSYLLVGRDSAQWFVRKDGAEDEDTLDSFALLQDEGISIERYDDAAAQLETLVMNGNTIVCDPDTLNGCFDAVVGENGRRITSPVPLKKAVKTPEEIEGFREACLEDGLAMEKFLFWLEGRLKEGAVSEWEASVKLSSLRAEIPGYQGDSFETISAWGPGGALPHYLTPRDGSTLIHPYGLYLCDSGGQYLFGTTDITRTIAAGETTYLEKEDYTIVLKGMIDLSMAVFPYGTAGCQIDALAREPLWRTGRNFGHGTGHGVGFFLCVHEGPQSIRQNFLQQPLLPGMVTSNEPGLYREGRHGIRHENLVLCREAYSNEFGRWLSFETLTLCHIDTSAVLPQLLSAEELDWLNSYNERVYNSFAPAMEGETEMLEWLRAKTRPLYL